MSETENVPTKFAFFLGCIMPNRYPQIEKATRFVMNKLNIELLDMERASCCPAPGVFRSFDKFDWMVAAARNICIAEQMSTDILTVCNGCFGTLFEVNKILKENENTRIQVNKKLKLLGDYEYQGTINVRHIAEVLGNQIGPSTLKNYIVRKVNAKAAIHYGCHFLKPTKIKNIQSAEKPTILEDIAEVLGVTSLEFKNKHTCCGAGGGVKSSYTDASMTIFASKMEDIAEVQPDFILDICPFCHLQFESGQDFLNKNYGTTYDIPVIHLSQLIAYCMGMEQQLVGLQYQLMGKCYVFKDYCEEGEARRHKFMAKAKKAEVNPDEVSSSESTDAQECFDVEVKASPISAHEARIGVFICHCGHNIAGIVDIEKVVEAVKNEPDVVIAQDYMFMCSKQGLDLVQNAVKEKGVNATVVASCSVTQHGPTFAHAIEEVGLNRHLHQQVDIREYCSWAHQKDPVRATAKAIKLVKAGINRARKLIPIETKRITTTKAALVIGAGIAGLRAASDLANLSIPVYLVEKESSIGGHMTQLNKTFPTNECPQCSISPLTNGVAHDPNITLMTYSTVKSIEGSYGNFQVEIETKPRYVQSTCTSCGECSEKCPVEVPSEWDSGMATRKAIYKLYPQAIPSTFVRDKTACIECMTCVNICPVHAVDFSMQSTTIKVNVGTIVVAVGYEEYDPTEIEPYHYGQKGYEDIMTQLQFERLVNPVSLTNGTILRPSDGKVPKKVVIIQCVGSRNDQVGNAYCTGVCCMFGLKNAGIIKDTLPECDLTMCYIDIRTPGLYYEEYYKSAQKKGVRFIRGRPSEIQRDPVSGELQVIVEDTLSQTPMEIPADMILLSSAMVPPKGVGILGSQLQVLRAKEGFLKEFHLKMNPTKSSREGIYLAGAIQGPKDITQSVAQAGSSASLAAAPLVQGFIEKEMLIAQIDYDKCVKCGMCIYACNPQAIKREGDKIVVNELGCKSCGMCQPVCPTGAIQLKNFTENQLLDEIIPLAGGHVHVVE